MKFLFLIIALTLLVLPSVLIADEPFYDPRCNLCGVLGNTEDDDITKYYAGNMSTLLCFGKKNRSSYIGHGIVTHPDDMCQLNDAVGKLCPPKNGTVFSLCCNSRNPNVPFRFANNAQQIAYQTQGFSIGLCSDFDGMLTVGPMRLKARCEDRTIVDLADHLSIYKYCNGDVREKRLNPNAVRSFLKDRGITISLPPGTESGADSCDMGGGSNCGPPMRDNPRCRIPSCSGFINAVDPAMTALGGCGYALEGLQDAEDGDVGGGCIKVMAGTGCATTGTSVTLSALGYSGAGCAVGAAAIPLTVCAGGVTAAGYGAYNCVQQSPSRGYVPESGGYSTGYWDCFCELYGIH